VREMSRRAITCCHGAVPVLDGNTFFCGCGNYRASQAANPEDRLLPFPEHMVRAFGGGAVEISRDPGAEEIRAVVEKSAPYGRIVLGTINAHLYPGQLKLARALADTGKELVAVALRNPYDIPLLPDCACKIAAYDYSAPCFQALEAVFRGGAVTGRLPVKLER